MANNNNNQLNVPEAREAMDQFKMEAANEVGVNLKKGYNGHLTSREAGSIGGQMVKKMVENYENSVKNQSQNQMQNRSQNQMQNQSNSNSSNS